MDSACDQALEHTDKYLQDSFFFFVPVIVGLICLVRNSCIYQFGKIVM